VIGEGSSSGLAIGTGNAYAFGFGKIAGPFYLTDNRNIFSSGFLHHLSRIRYTRAFDDAVGCEYPVFGMLAFFPFYLVLLQFTLVFVLNSAFVRYKYAIALYFGQYSRTNTAFAGAKNNDIFIVILHYLIFSVITVTMARNTARIQNRATILASWYSFFW
jgi:hypothetical protein